MSNLAPGKRLVKRGEIYTCQLPKSKGSVQKRNRPCVILQNNVGNRFSPVVIVAVISSQRYGSTLPTHVHIDKSITLLKENSTVLLEQIFTLDKSQLGKKIADLSTEKEIMDGIDAALKVSLGL